MSQKFWEWAFKVSNSAYRWTESAERLKHSADLLFGEYFRFCSLSPEEQAETEDSKVAGVATLLYGLAMENILKAVLLKERIAKVETDGRVCWNVDGATRHDLVSMCKSSGFVSLDAQQEKLMERMSAFVYWAGKYPTPLALRNKKDYQGLLLSNQPSAGSEMTPVEFGFEDKDSFEALYRALWKRAVGAIRRRKT